MLKTCKYTAIPRNGREEMLRCLHFDISHRYMEGKINNIIQ